MHLRKKVHDQWLRIRSNMLHAERLPRLAMVIPSSVDENITQFRVVIVCLCVCWEPIRILCVIIRRVYTLDICVLVYIGFRIESHCIAIDTPHCAELPRERVRRGESFSIIYTYCIDRSCKPKSDHRAIIPSFVCRRSVCVLWLNNVRHQRVGSSHITRHPNPSRNCTDTIHSLHHTHTHWLTPRSFPSLDPELLRRFALICNLHRVAGVRCLDDVKCMFAWCIIIIITTSTSHRAHSEHLFTTTEPPSDTTNGAAQILRLCLPWCGSFIASRRGHIAYI